MYTPVKHILLLWAGSKCDKQFGVKLQNFTENPW